MPEEQYEREWLALGLSELTALMLSTRDIEESLRHIANIASRMLPGRPMAGVTMTRGGDTTTVASTEAHATLIDEVQYASGTGPCLESMTRKEPVSVPDVAAEERWGDYPSRMLAHGVRSIYSQPLTADGETIGALNLYSRRLEGFPEESRRAIALTGEHTGVLLSAAINVARQAELTDQLREALVSRSVIDQALGIVMGQRSLTRSAAFDLLRAASQGRNIRLADLAAEIVEAVTGEPPESLWFADPWDRPPPTT